MAASRGLRRRSPLHLPPPPLPLLLARARWGPSSPTPLAGAHSRRTASSMVPAWIWVRVHRGPSSSLDWALVTRIERSHCLRPLPQLKMTTISPSAGSIVYLIFFLLRLDFYSFSAQMQLVLYHKVDFSLFSPRMQLVLYHKVVFLDRRFFFF